MRCQRTVTSISACSSMCPMCNKPVTLGGGMTSENTGADPFAEAWKTPEWIHHCAQCGSNRCGSYTFSICMGKIPIYQGRWGGPLGLPISTDGIALLLGRSDLRKGS